MNNSGLESADDAHLGETVVDAAAVTTSELVSIAGVGTQGPTGLGEQGRQRG